MTTEEVLADKKVTDKLTRAMCCPTSDGSACQGRGCVSLLSRSRRRLELTLSLVRADLETTEDVGCKRLDFVFAT